MLRALDGVTLSVQAGEIFGLVGPNRAGKTTLVKILLSICRPTVGPRAAIGRSLVGSQHAGPCRATCTRARLFRVISPPAELLEYYGALSQVPGRARPPAAARLAGAIRPGRSGREPIRRFSKGMLQRLALAQALINDPELLVLDEPSEGMDLVAWRLLDEVLVERKARATRRSWFRTLWPTSSGRCDRVAVLRAGRAAFVGPRRAS